MWSLGQKDQRFIAQTLPSPRVRGTGPGLLFCQPELGWALLALAPPDCPQTLSWEGFQQGLLPDNICTQGLRTQ